MKFKKPVEIMSSSKKAIKRTLHSSVVILMFTLMKLVPDMLLSPRKAASTTLSLSRLNFF